MSIGKVEIGIGSGWLTPIASIVWTDISDYVDFKTGYQIDHGRGDERSSADASTLTLTLDNYAGLFSPGTAGWSAMQPKVGLPIRVTQTPAGQTGRVRFLGYVREWPMSADGLYSTVQITATSRLANLEKLDSVDSMLATVTKLTAPAAYWRMVEPSGSSLADDMGGPSLVGVGGVVGQITVGGLDMGAGVIGVPPTEAINDDTKHNVWFQASRQLGAAIPALNVTNGYTMSAWVDLVNTGGAVGWAARPYAATASYPGINFDPSSGVANATLGMESVGRLVHAVYSQTTTSTALYLNGVLVYSDTSGWPLPNPIVGVNVGFNLIGSVGHVALWNRVLTAAEITGIYRAGSDGWAGETSGARVQRLAGWAGIAAADVSVPTTGKAVGLLDTSGKTVADLMRLIESTEQGLLHDRADGLLELLPISGRYNAVSSWTLDMAALDVDQPGWKFSDPINRATVTAADGMSVTMSGASSIAAYGVNSTSVDIAGTQAQASQLASWLIFHEAEPQPVLVDLACAIEHLAAAAQATALDALAVGTKITVTNLPGQSPATSLDVFVEGLTETYSSAGGHRFALNVSSAALFAVYRCGVDGFGTVPLAY